MTSFNLDILHQSHPNDPPGMGEALTTKYLWHLGPYYMYLWGGLNSDIKTPPLISPWLDVSKLGSYFTLRPHLGVLTGVLMWSIENQIRGLNLTPDNTSEVHVLKHVWIIYLSFRIKRLTKKTLSGMFTRGSLFGRTQTISWMVETSTTS